MEKSNLRHILIAEDREIIRLQEAEFCEEVLGELASDNIHTVSNGKEALSYIKDLHQRKNRLYNLISLDLKMPLMSGDELFRELKKYKTLAPQTKKIMVVTGCIADAQEKIPDFDGFGMLEKPFSAANYKAQLKKYLI